MVSLVEVKEAQRAWGEGIVAIATAHTNGGDYIGLATDHVFKPTLAATDQFRPTFQTALSYFVASNNACPEDQGFAIKGWTNVRFENSDVIIDGNTALAMGNYFFTSQEGSEVKVEYTFGYIKADDGSLRIQLHHSSLPAESN